MAYTKYSLTPANNNATPPDGAPEGMLPSAVNDTMRDMMAQIRDCGDGIRDGTYTMTAPKITGGTITGAAFTGNTFTSPVISGGTINNAVIGGSTAAAGTFTSLSDSGNLTFTGTGNRITGDFSSGVASRVLVQSSTTNGATSFSLISNGTSTNSTFTAFAGSDAANSSGIQISANGSAARLVAINNGTSSAVPITFGQGNTEQMRIDTSGNVGIGTSSPGAKLDVSGANAGSVLSSRILNTSTSANSDAQQFIYVNSGTAGDPYTTWTVGGVSAFSAGIRNSDSDKWYLTTGSSLASTAVMVVDASGNVGIGTSSPTDRIHAAASVAAGLSLQATGTSGSTWRLLSTDSGASIGGGYLGFNNGSYRMVIDSSGNVGIGTSSPTSFYDVNTKFAVYKPTSGSTYINQVIGTDNVKVGLFVNDDANKVALLAVQTNHPLAFNTNSSERMRITSDGYVGIGTTTPASYGALAVRKGINGTWLGVSGNCSFQTSDNNLSSLYVVHSSANSNTTFIGADSGGRLQMFCSATAAGGVYLANGGTSWTSASDERVKENLAPIQNGLEKVTSLRAVTGNFINDENKKSRAFLIAQDVQKVFPQAVDSSNPDELGLAYTDVIPLLVAAMKEQQAMIEELKAKVAALETK